VHVQEGYEGLVSLDSWTARNGVKLIHSNTLLQFAPGILRSLIREFWFTCTIVISC
jgi:hypothetical protein